MQLSKYQVEIVCRNRKKYLWNIYSYILRKLFLAKYKRIQLQKFVK